mmetsp:Transcript_12445/g.24798  ORF Transcript_12445/g.24798 Transcript_12445/m.24798 type:complete len:253 (-) Transcript_12445:588-1346(-)
MLSRCPHTGFITGSPGAEGQQSHPPCKILRGGNAVGRDEKEGLDKERNGKVVRGKTHGCEQYDRELRQGRKGRQRGGHTGRMWRASSSRKIYPVPKWGVVVAVVHTAQMIQKAVVQRVMTVNFFCSSPGTAECNEERGQAYCGGRHAERATNPQKRVARQGPRTGPRKAAEERAAGGPARRAGRGPLPPAEIGHEGRDINCGVQPVVRCDAESHPDEGGRSVHPPPAPPSDVGAAVRRGEGEPDGRENGKEN